MSEANRLRMGEPSERTAPADGRPTIFLFPDFRQISQSNKSIIPSHLTHMKDFVSLRLQAKAKINAESESEKPPLPHSESLKNTVL